jgi:serine/threonine-protein kinase RsbW
MWRPPRADEEVARWRVDQPPQLAAMRAALHRAISALRLGAVDMTDLAERLMFVATELAGNALRHGRPPTVVVLLRADGHLIVDVRDNARDRPAVDPARPAGEGGLGLPLTERLAQEVGWYPAAASKHVWALFSVDAD